MPNFIVKTLILFLFLTTLTDPAFAHKVNVFAYVEGDTVYTESFFPDGRPVEGGTIEVLDDDGKKLLEGKTDMEGKFSFVLPAREDLTIAINASMGHKNSFVLKKDDM
ncbi:MAG: carboxypeptidase regulatory-like domain-containing protein [Pseudomonadota bacterium]